MNKNISAERVVFGNLMNRFKAKEIPSAPAPHFLRVEKVLTNNSGRLSFDIYSSSGQGVTESKLNTNDLFVATKLGFFLLKEETAKPGIGVLQTYPNPIVFPAVATPGSEFDPAHMEAIYSGSFSLKTQQTVNIERLSMLNFRAVPQTQKSATIANSEFGLVDVAYVGAEDIYLDGGKNHEITIDFPTFSGMTIESKVNGTVHKAVFMAFGYIVKGAGTR